MLLTIIEPNQIRIKNLKKKNTKTTQYVCAVHAFVIPFLYSKHTILVHF